ncbi:hypothetical protein [Limimaricola sp. AA108-03]|uniref:hypothetical protein n=1 Tax=Limimaricola sp. AA108-03 TaxID=3425945 RepID=UPI003D76EA2C
MDNRYYTMPLQMWQAGFKMWSTAFDMQMSMMSAFLPKAREIAEEGADLTQEAGNAALAGSDFARKAAQSVANANAGNQDRAMPV